jgi:hypothetical protein
MIALLQDAPGDSVTVYASNPDGTSVSNPKRDGPSDRAAAAASVMGVQITVSRSVSGLGCKPASGGGTTFALTLPTDPQYMGQTQGMKCTYS